jgi:hypothetical protein
MARPTRCPNGCPTRCPIFGSGRRRTNALIRGPARTRRRPGSSALGRRRQTWPRCRRASWRACVAEWRGPCRTCPPGVGALTDGFNASRHVGDDLSALLPPPTPERARESFDFRKPDGRPPAVRGRSARRDQLRARHRRRVAPLPTAAEPVWFSSDRMRPYTLTEPRERASITVLPRWSLGRGNWVFPSRWQATRA